MCVFRLELVFGFNQRIRDDEISDRGAQQTRRVCVNEEKVFYSLY